MDKKFLVSIILPTYNGGKYIKKSIESVITQSFSDWELLIIDDGSTDNTFKIVQEFVKNDFRIIYLKNEKNLGIQKSLNRGLREAKGEYIARIDDDDKWIDRDKLKKQVEFLDDNNDYDLVGTGVVVVNENGKELFRYLLPETDEKIRGKILSKNCFVHSSVLFRKNKTLSVGGYSEDAKTKHIEDYDLWLKLGEKGKFHNLPFYGVSFTLRSGSISSENKINQFEKNINLIDNYKNNYPHYISAKIISYARKLVYGLIIKSPLKLYLNKIIKLYKNL